MIHRPMVVSVASYLSVDDYSSSSPLLPLLIEKSWDDNDDDDDDKDCCIKGNICLSLFKFLFQKIKRQVSLHIFILKKRKTGRDYNKNSIEHQARVWTSLYNCQEAPGGLEPRSDKVKRCLPNLLLLSITKAAFIWSLAFLPSNNPKRIKWLLSTYNGPGLVLSS